MRLSDDYDGFGKFSLQVLGITLALFVPSGIIMYISLIYFSSYLGFLSIIIPFGFFIWGNLKQCHELKKRNYAFTDDWKRRHLND